MFFRKSLILVGTDNKTLKGVLSLERNFDGVVGTLRLYNFNEEPSGILSLGVMSGKNIIKAGLTKKSNMLYSFACENEPEEHFSCAVINFNQGRAKPLLYGSTDGQNQNENRLVSCISALYDEEKENKIEKVKEKLDEENIDFEAEEKEQIEKEIEEEICSKPCCASCKYREVFFEEENNKNEDQIEQEDKPNHVNRFFDKIKGEIEAIFEKYPEEEFLKKIVPGSKWARVEYDETGEYYVVGLIYENDNIKYVCYGVPGIYEKTPPKELSGYPVWFSLDETKPEGFGYWLTYQDADSGEEIKVEVI